MKSMNRLLKEHEDDFGKTGISSGNKRIRTDRSGSLRYVGMPNHVTDFVSQDNRKIVDLDPAVITAPNSNWERHRAWRRRYRDEVIAATPQEPRTHKDIIDQT